MPLLIYPYWNVNIRKAIDYIDTAALLIYPYWNVNREKKCSKCEQVNLLIYPYWNVNRGIDVIANFPVDAFNISILECKL